MTAKPPVPGPAWLKPALLSAVCLVALVLAARRVDLRALPNPRIAELRGEALLVASHEAVRICACATAMRPTDLPVAVCCRHSSPFLCFRMHCHLAGASLRALPQVPPSDKDSYARPEPVTGLMLDRDVLLRREFLLAGHEMERAISFGDSRRLRRHLARLMAGLCCCRCGR